MTVGAHAPMRWEDRVGTNVRRLRKAKGLSQEALAHEAGMAMRYLAGIERGEENPSLAILVKLSGALGISPADLFG
ncbi:helix-turn-helix domain-containing protein [Brevundimonas nasdae]|uniref:helix-turn-helix domain-containing protein n=1 Tax=Brevundimonas nasdae TaxID=172043 RepID=UPI001F0B01AB|nr:helix-turn-helix transcriptional regulator [Brevundimonas nasdae]